MPISLNNKYFINTLSVGTSGQQSLVRGRILGPVHEMIPAYLCELHPVDPATLALSNQIILPLDQLMGIYLFDDEAIWQLEWDRLVKLLDESRARAKADNTKARRRATRRGVKQTAEDVMAAIEARTGGSFIHVDPNDPAAIEKLLSSIFEQQDQVMEPASADDELAGPPVGHSPEMNHWSATDEGVQQPETDRQYDDDPNDDLDR